MGNSLANSVEQACCSALSTHGEGDLEVTRAASHLGRAAREDLAPFEVEIGRHTISSRRSNKVFHFEHSALLMVYGGAEDSPDGGGLERYFEVLDELGRGTFGTVVAARHRQVGDFGFGAGGF